MASALFFLDLKGKTLLARNYRGDIPMSAVEKFPVLLSEAEDESSSVPPCFSSEGINYLYIRHNNLYLLALTKRNTNAAEILLFLHKIVEVFTEYFKELEEESIRDNFVVIYELLDEIMDFGHPQTTETKILQEYITQESHQLQVQARPPIAVTNAVSWRSEGIRYRKNEVFLDVVESLNLLVSSTGNVLRSEILGAVKMKCYLSGMPELRLGLNDKVMFEATGRNTRGKAVEMEDVKFHQCVRLSRFESDRTISFIPPDGEFELMSYRLNTQVKPLIWVECIVESHSGSRIEYMLKVDRVSEPLTHNDLRMLTISHRQKHNSNAAQQPTTSKFRSQYLKTQTHPNSAPTSAQCTTRPKPARSYGRSSNSAVAKSSSCAPSSVCPV
jgi:AP-1 complex subunit mu